MDRMLIGYDADQRFSCVRLARYQGPTQDRMGQDRMLIGYDAD